MLRGGGGEGPRGEMKGRKMEGGGEMRKSMGRGQGVKKMGGYRRGR